MSKIKSLQYLLLDTLKKKNLSKEEHNRISKSLKIKLDKDNYLISWIDDKILKKASINVNKFVFYSRNDVQGIKSDNFLEKNNNNAKEVIDKIVQGKYLQKKKIKIISKGLFSLVYFLITFFFTSYFAEIDIKISLMAIFSVMLSEIIIKNNLFTPVLILIISLIFPNELWFFTSVFYLIFYIFDNYTRFKYLNFILLVITIFINFKYFGQINIEYSINLILVLIIYLIIMMNNFFRYNSNSLWIYVFPAFSFIFFFNNLIIECYVILFASYFYYKISKLAGY